MASSPTSGVLHGLSILVVEDNYVQAEEIRLCLADAGAAVLGPTGLIEEAVELIALNSIDVAVVDINLGDGPMFEVASHLLQANLPFVFVTGYDCRTLPEEFRHVQCLQKPFSEVYLLQALASLSSQ